MKRAAKETSQVDPLTFIYWLESVEWLEKDGDAAALTETGRSW